MTGQSKRIIVVCAPALAYTLSRGVAGNGFVAAFVCGVAYHYSRRSQDAVRELELLDDLSFLLTAAMLESRFSWPERLMLGSVFLHGFGAPAAARAFARSQSE